MSQSADLTEPGRPMTRRPPAHGHLADIKHPLTAIMANADAARRWLSRTNPNFQEAIAALERIVKECSRIDDAIASLGAMAAGEDPDRHLA